LVVEAFLLLTGRLAARTSSGHAPGAGGLCKPPPAADTPLALALAIIAQ
jgi:hypothetical protein